MLRSLLTPLIIALCAGSSFYYTVSNQNAQTVHIAPAAQVNPGGGVTATPNLQPPPPPLPPSRLPDVDAMIVIDNSGSMFGYTCNSHEQLKANDLDQLRIQGAELIIGSLAADLRPRETNLGIVTFGDQATLVSPLSRLDTNRDQLAEKVKNPPCQGDTNIADALRLAQRELHSERATPGNTPAIIFLTDGNPTRGTLDDIKPILDELEGVQFFAFLLGTDLSKSFWQGQSQKHPNITYYELTTSEGIIPLYNLLTGKLNQVDVSGAPALPPGQRVTIPVPDNVRQAVMKVIKRSPRVTVTIADPDGNDPHTLPPDRFRSLLNNSIVEVYVVDRPKPGNWTFSVPDNEQITVLQPEYRSIYQVQLLQPDSLGLLATDQLTNLVVQVVDIDTQQVLTGKFILTSAYRPLDQPESANQPMTLADGPVAPQYNVQLPAGTFTEGQEYILTFQVQDDTGLGSQPTIYQLLAGRLPVITSVSANPLTPYVDQPINLVVQTANADVVDGAASVTLAPLPDIGGVTFQSTDTTTYTATVPALKRPGNYALSVFYRGKIAGGRDFNSTSSVAVTVREYWWMPWLRNLALAFAILSGAFLLFRFVLLNPLIPFFQRIGISPAGYVRTISPGSKYPNEEINLRDVLRRKRKLRSLSLGVGPRFDIPLDEPSTQADEEDGDTPPNRPGLRERLWGPKPLARITRNGSNTELIVGSGAGSSFGNGVRSREIEENTIEYSLKSIVDPDGSD